MANDYIFKTIATYNATAQEYDQKIVNYAPFRERKMFTSLIPKDGKVLDAGCGPGRDSEYFVDNGFQVVGIDLAEEFIKIAKKKVPKGRFLVMDLRSIDLPDGAFDGIWACASLLHLKKLEVPRVLQKFRLLLKDSGVLFILVKEGQGESGAHGVLPNSPEKFYSYFSEREMRETLAANGFDITDISVWDQYDRWQERPSEKWISCFAKKK